MARRIVVKGGSGSGKTTVAAAIAENLGVPHVELDALNHGPNWTQASPQMLRARLEEQLRDRDGWVVDGNYDSKLGTWLLDQADLIIWLDLALWVKLRRLWRRTLPRIRQRHELWNGNVESWRGAFVGRDALFAWAIRSHFRHRRDWPRLLGERSVVRLRSPAEIERFVQRGLVDVRYGRRST